MSLWVDKHRPTDINKLDYHVEQAKKLNQLVMDISNPSNRPINITIAKSIYIYI